MRVFIIVIVAMKRRRAGKQIKKSTLKHLIGFERGITTSITSAAEELTFKKSSYIYARGILRFNAL